LFDEITGLRLGTAALTEGTGEIGLVPLFRAFGVRRRRRSRRPRGAGHQERTDDGWVRVTQVLDGGAGQAALGGDLLAAVDGLRVAPGQLDKMLARYRPGDDGRTARLPARRAAGAAGDAGARAGHAVQGISGGGQACGTSALAGPVILLSRRRRRVR
jgi:hypothetical protein